jgi:single-strand DNA-binding protein
MGKDLNMWIGIGRLTADARLNTGGHSPRLEFSIAVNDSYKSQSGERVEKVSYFDCVIWGKMAESLAQYLTKGKQIGMSGKLEQQRWTDQATGQNRSRVQLVINELQLIGGGREKSDRGYENQDSYGADYGSRF